MRKKIFAFLCLIFLCTGPTAQAVNIAELEKQDEIMGWSRSWKTPTSDSFVTAGKGGDYPTIAGALSGITTVEPLYSTGTITVIQSAEDISGSGVDWSPYSAYSDLVIQIDSIWYRVRYSSSTVVKLHEPDMSAFPAPTVVGKSYTLGQIKPHTILVLPGTYTGEHGNIPSFTTVDGLGGAFLISTSPSGSIFEIKTTSRNVILRGFRVHQIRGGIPGGAFVQLKMDGSYSYSYVGTTIIEKNEIVAWGYDGIYNSNGVFHNLIIRHNYISCPYDPVRLANVEKASIYGNKLYVVPEMGSIWQFGRAIALFFGITAYLSESQVDIYDNEMYISLPTDEDLSMDYASAVGLDSLPNSASAIVRVYDNRIKTTVRSTDVNDTACGVHSLDTAYTGAATVYLRDNFFDVTNTGSGLAYDLCITEDTTTVKTSNNESLNSMYELSIEP